MPRVRCQEPEVRRKSPEPLTPCPEPWPSNRFAFASYAARISTPGSLSTCRRRTIQFSKIVECRQPACAGFDLFQPDFIGLRRFHQDAGFGSALIQPRKTELNTLAFIPVRLTNPLPAQTGLGGITKPLNSLILNYIPASFYNLLRTNPIAAYRQAKLFGLETSQPLQDAASNLL